MKTKILIAAVMFFALSVAAFAQSSAQFTVGSVPVTTVSSCGVTERTGDVLFTTVAGTGAVASGTFTVNYGVPITNNLVAGAVTGITVTPTFTAGGGATLTTTLDPTLNTATTLASGLLTITVTATNVTAANNAVQIVLDGVRVNVSGTALTSLTATLSSTTNAIVAGQTSVIVISAIAPALASVTIDNPGTVGVGAPFGTALATGVNVNAATAALTPAAGTANILVKENFVTAFEPPGNGGTGAIVQLTFSAVPTGVTIALPLVVTSDKGYGFQAVNLTVSNTGAITGTTSATTAPTFTSLSTTLSAYYLATTPSVAVGFVSATSIDTLVILATVTSDPTKVPISPGPITVTVQMAPSNATGSTYIPRYAGTQCALAPATVVTVATGQTFMLMTYAVNTLGYDTGIAVANTTSDPVTPAGLSAAKQGGTLTFTFYPLTSTSPNTVTPFSYTPGASATVAIPGSGLTSTGVLTTGNTYAVRLSDLLTAAGQTATGSTPGTFQGYIIVTCNFTNGHGQYFVYVTATGGSMGTAHMNVFVPPRGAVPENLND